MIDALWIAVEGVAYFLSEKEPATSLELVWIIDRHPCDNALYVADIQPRLLILPWPQLT
jgi:hypothetical protein